MRAALTIALILLLAACVRDRGGVRADLPPACPVVEPQLQVVEKRVYVSIPKRLTQRAPIAEGPIAQAFEVAARRRAALEKANAQLAEIETIEGTEVQP